MIKGACSRGVAHRAISYQIPPMGEVGGVHGKKDETEPAEAKNARH